MNVQANLISMHEPAKENETNYQNQTGYCYVYV